VAGRGRAGDPTDGSGQPRPEGSDVPYHRFVEHLPVGILAVEAPCASVYANRAARALLGDALVPDRGQPEDEPDADTYRVFVAGTDDPYPDVSMPIVRALQGQSTIVTDMEIRRGKTVVPIEVWAIPVVDEAGKIDYAVAAFHDISARREAEEALRHAALHDPLTDLANRSLFEQHLIQAAARAQRSRSVFAVAFIDLDGFKAVNDQLGHRAGDQVLLATARRLRGALRASDTLARIGGDEFAVLLEGLEEGREAELVARRLAQHLQEPVPLDHDREARVTASVGLALGSGDTTATELLARADHAMYRAKAQGGERYTVFTS
jgi:diguanylate cyclase (GGDEF)-like protein